MSLRVASKPIPVPAGVEVTIQTGQVTVKGPKGTNIQVLPNIVNIELKDGTICVSPKDKDSIAMAGTARALLNNHVIGVTQGFEKKLTLKGVGYKAAAGKSGKQATLNLTLGLSHPEVFTAPEGVELATPTASEIVVTGIDKQLVGQVAANIRSVRGGVRKPEPYKGKGIRYADEVLVLKEAKKK